MFITFASRDASVCRATVDAGVPCGPCGPRSQEPTRRPGDTDVV